MHRIHESLFYQVCSPEKQPSLLCTEKKYPGAPDIPNLEIDLLAGPQQLEIACSSQHQSAIWCQFQEGQKELTIQLKDQDNEVTLELSSSASISGNIHIIGGSGRDAVQIFLSQQQPFKIVQTQQQKEHLSAQWKKGDLEIILQDIDVMHVFQKDDLP